MNSQAVLKAPFLWVALDGFSEDYKATLKLMHTLDQVPGNFGFKVNGDALYECGIPFFKSVLPSGRRKFADTKMWFGARTMARAFYNFHRAGFDLVNAWAWAGGYPDEEDKGAELKRAIEIFKNKVHGETKLKIYAVTVLSHYTDKFCRRQHGVGLPAAVRNSAEEGLAAGADGIIVPGTTLSKVEDLPGSKLLTGLRTPFYQDAEHAQELSTEEVAGRGDLEVVCGSPITKNTDPVGALNQVLQAITR